MFCKCNVTININNAPAPVESADAIAKATKFEQMYYLQRAANVAIRSNIKHHRHGCVIVNIPDGKIIAEGYNHTKDDLTHCNSIHAEVHALSRYKIVRKMYPNCALYVVRVGTERMGYPLKFSKPCHRCSEAIMTSGIRQVYYSTSKDEEIVKC